MRGATSMKIGQMDFSFENSLVKVIANRNCPEITLAGLTVGPFEEGNEYEVYYWVGCELEKSGIGHLREEETLDVAKLYKIQWKERALTGGQIGGLSDDFYPKLRRQLTQMRDEVARVPERMMEYERMKHLTRDVVNSRLKKIVSLASAPAQIEQTLKNFTPEERFLYEQLSKLIHSWRNQILELEELEK